MKKYEVIVIGSGPGGEGASMRLAKRGKNVAIVEDFPVVGGNCTHRGTIPSKAIRQASQKLSDKESAFTDYQTILGRANSVIAQQVDLRQSFYSRNGVKVIPGRASFIDEHTIEVVAKNGAKERYQAEHFVIATGSRPYHPDDLDFNHPRILDSDTLINCPSNPKSVTIYGAGVIGCEYASIFRRLNIKVNLINTRDKLLSFLDDEIIDALSYHLRENGVMIRHNEEYESIEANDKEVIIKLKSNKVIKSEILLYAFGRSGNSDNMGLENLGIEIDKRQSIVVNENYQSSIPHIYAVGDVVGYPSLASASYDQGRYAALHIVEGKCNHELLELIPTGIYTIPEISCIGKTEVELTKEKVPYEIGHSFFRHLARAQITGNTTGILKILFHRETLEVLGVHCFGAGAAEIIHIGQVVMSQKGEANSLMYFVNTTFNYPTMAEAYRVAALNGLNRIS